MSRRDEAKRFLEEAMRAAGVAGDVAKGAEEAYGAHAGEFFDQLADKVHARATGSRDYPQPKDEQCRAVGDIFAGLADEARALRMRMEKTS
jgi:hypothetical protein